MSSDQILLSNKRKLIIRKLVLHEEMADSIPKATNMQISLELLVVPEIKNVL